MTKSPMIKVVNFMRGTKIYCGSNTEIACFECFVMLIYILIFIYFDNVLILLKKRDFRGFLREMGNFSYLIENNNSGMSMKCYGILYIQMK